MGSPSLQVFHNSGDVALRDVGSGHGGVGHGLKAAVGEQLCEGLPEVTGLS